MYQMIIAVFVGIILGIFGLWYVTHKKKTNKNLKLLEDLKLEFDDEYHSFIDEISHLDDSYSIAMHLLKIVQVYIEQETVSEMKIKEYEEIKSNVTKGLNQKNHEIVHISHQMRTSLSGLIGFAQFLHSTELTEEQEEFLSIIEISTNELLDLVNSIIDMTPKPRENEEKEKEYDASVEPFVKNKIPHILVVDDNDINKKLLSKVLEHENLKVVYASNGEEAVRLRAENHFDIIFMDIQMPVMDGVEASKAIRAYEDTKNIAQVPIIALTANTGKDDRDTYLDAGMTDYMAKPIMIEDVRKRIAQL